MTRQNIDDPRKLRDMLARTQTLATLHEVPSVVVGFASSEGNLLFPEFLAFLESELRVEDQIFRLTRERALLVLRDVDCEQATTVVERLRASFEQEFPSIDPMRVEIRYFEVPPGRAELSVKTVLPIVLGGQAAADD
jgi:GGDEF domain-containing protein